MDLCKRNHECKSEVTRRSSLRSSRSFWEPSNVFHELQTHRIRTILLPTGMWSNTFSRKPLWGADYTDVDSSWTLGRTTWCANCKQIIGAIICQVATKTSPLHCNDPANTAICVWVCETQRETHTQTEILFKLKFLKAISTSEKSEKNWETPQRRRLP